MGNIRVPLDVRLWSKVDKNGPVMPKMTTCCWQWTGAIRKQGYGQIGEGGAASDGARNLLVHRVVYMRLVGPIPEGLELDHLCRNKRCCRPEHLEAVTRRTNTLRGESPAAKANRRNRCANGHEYTIENTYMAKGIHRHCRTCMRVVQKRLRAEGYWRPGGAGYDKERNKLRQRKFRLDRAMRKVTP